MPLRVTAYSGLASVALLVPIAILLTATDYPFADASTDEVIAYFGDHRTAFMTAIVIELLSLGFVFMFVAGLASHLPKAVAGTTLIAGAAMATLIGGEITTLAAAGFRPTSAVIEVLWSLGHFGLGMLLHVTTAIFVAAATVGLAGRGGRLPASSSRAVVAVAGLVAAVGSATVPFGYLGRSVDFVAGFAEHLISTGPYAVWVVVACLAIMDPAVDDVGVETSR